MDEYSRRWLALYELVDEGQSWSGHERHCCFLNVNGEQFADISAASKLDLPDDGRALAICDWNHDGLIDFWLTNRNGPRLRLLGNATRSDHNYLKLRLEGQSCNRDAIGARVEVVFRHSDSQPLIKTLHAGDGYLAQSSKWMHFGLGEHQAPVDIRVQWPDGSTEVIRGLAPNQHYRLTQHTQTPKVWEPPRHTTQFKDEPIAARKASAARTWMVGRIPLPELHYMSWDGDQQLVRFNGRPLLLNLWSSDCVTCIEEFETWSHGREQIDELALDIVALNVDALTGSADQRNSRQTTIDKMNVPGISGLATLELIDVLEISHRAIVELKQPLPIPCSFLFDEHGHLAGVYKGPVSIDDLSRDVLALGLSVDDRRNHAIPFSGKWIVKPGKPSPRRLIAGLVQAQRTDAAMRYLLDYLDRDDTFKSDSLKADLYELHANVLWDRKHYEEAAETFRNLLELAPDRGEMHEEIGRRLLVQNYVADAIEHLLLAARHRPEDVELQMNIGLQAMGIGNMALAIDQFQIVLKQQPKLAMVHFHLANLLVTDDPASAIKHYRRASQLEPVSPATNNLAWLLATHSDARIRNGNEAVELATSLCEKSGYQDATLLDTLAAAYAETAETICISTTPVPDDSKISHRRLESKISPPACPSRGEILTATDSWTPTSATCFRLPAVASHTSVSFEVHSQTRLSLRFKDTLGAIRCFKIWVMAVSPTSVSTPR